MSMNCTSYPLIEFYLRWTIISF